MTPLKYVLLSAIFLTNPSYAVESTDSAPLEKETVEQQHHVDDASDKDANKAEKTDLHKHHHHKHLSKRPYKKHTEPNTETQIAKEDSPHKHIYHRHTSKRPHAKNVSH